MNLKVLPRNLCGECGEMAMFGAEGFMMFSQTQKVHFRCSAETDHSQLQCIHPECK